ncbi:hypothetical protein AB0K60_18200 [Thermopolyspora sp. NPDC052614]|uniref:hypothetical protein n=1 Tax=Thermopolyspora sp. NPDC052614 TaxID=3155682 RepID=UPI003431D881
MEPGRSGFKHGEGSGVELREVRYRGRLVLRQAHVPILNVLHRALQCRSDSAAAERGAAKKRGNVSSYRVRSRFLSAHAARLYELSASSQGE